MTSILNLDDIGVLDRQIEQLYDYKPIAEHEVKALCDKVTFISSQCTYKGIVSLWIVHTLEVPTYTCLTPFIVG